MVAKTTIKQSIVMPSNFFQHPVQRFNQPNPQRPRNLFRPDHIGFNIG